jgi:hypothetical protein
MKKPACFSTVESLSGGMLSGPVPENRALGRKANQQTRSPWIVPSAGAKLRCFFGARLRKWCPIEYPLRWCNA